LELDAGLHDLVALNLIDDRLCRCSIFVSFVSFVFFVVPILRRSRVQPVSVRFRNLATLSSGAARWIFDLTWISRIEYAIVATWLSFGSFCAFRAFRFVGSFDRAALGRRWRLARGRGDPQYGRLDGWIGSAAGGRRPRRGLAGCTSSTPATLSLSPAMACL
jgi:hypothetical protein